MLLLDTCVLLYVASDQSRISSAAVAAINAEPTDLHVSAISAFEIGIKCARKRLTLSMPPDEWFREAVEKYDLHVVPILWEDAILATRLPWIHRDPADRILVATAVRHGMSIITPDNNIARYPQAKAVW